MGTLLPFFTAAAMLASAHSVAEERASPVYPAKPIRLIVSAAPGTPPDALARIVAEPFSASLAKPVVVDNRPGGNATIGLALLVKAAPDGHTLAIIGLPQMVAPSLVRDVPYDLARDVAPITQLVWTANILVVRAASPMQTVADFVALAKAKPGALMYASAGNGSPSHLASALFKQWAGIDVRHVPYKGIPAGLAAVLGEQVDIAFAGAATALPLVKSGRLRALGTAGARRLPALPELQTIAELGFAGFSLNEWYGVVSPAGTRLPIIGKVAGEMTRIIASPERQDRLANLGLYPAEKRGPEALALLIGVEVPRWQQIVRSLDIRPD